jgi:hypothetical protein
MLSFNNAIINILFISELLAPNSYMEDRIFLLPSPVPNSFEIFL